MNHEQLYNESRMEFYALQKRCQEKHITPLLALTGLPVGTVITKEYNEQLDSDYWHIQIGTDSYQGSDILQLLTKIR